jgi:hypothetical protein
MLSKNLLLIYHIYVIKFWVAKLSQICPASHRIDAKSVLDSSESIWYYWRKGNNEEYLKIKKTVEEEVSKFLTDGKVLLQVALASVIESIRRNPDKYNDLLVGNASLSSTPAQYSLLSHIEGCKDTILEAADKLYDILLKHFTSTIYG